MALDQSYETSAIPAPPRTSVLVQAAVIGALILAAGGLIAYRGAEEGWRFAGELVARYAELIFFLVLLIEPISRIFPRPLTRALGAERGNILVAFAAALSISLALILLTWLLGYRPMSAAGVFYVLLTGVILAGMLSGSKLSIRRFLGEPARRAILRIATVYFWLAFFLVDVSRLTGPDARDPLAGISIAILLALLVFQVCATLIAKRRARLLAAKPV